MEPGVTCGECAQCRGGMYNLCPKVQFWATPPVDGALCKYVVHPARLCFKIPDSMSFDEGAMVEPVSVAMHGCRTAGISPGNIVLVLGCGPIGLLCALCARSAFGAAQIVVVDPIAARANYSASVCSGIPVVVKPSDSAEDMVSKIRASMGTTAETPFDCCIDATGKGTPIAAGLLMCRPAGTMCCVGTREGSANVPLLATCNVREVVLKGIFRYRNTWPTCIRLISSGTLKVSSLIHPHIYRMDTATEAFSLAKRGLDDTGKPVVKVVIHID
ncbi:sorbitol dehydrogenase [Pelomyxa schiedti]|nr:sorbitol dehydrogenase [Pelomyxa schiedti]